MAGVYLVIAWKCTYSTVAYPANAILLRNAAPNLLLMGTVNGVSASTASLCRAFGPAVSGFLYAVGLGDGVLRARMVVQCRSHYCWRIRRPAKLRIRRMMERTRSMRSLHLLPLVTEEV